MKLLECISAITSLIGVYLLSDQQYVSGWIINAIGDVLWVWWAYLKSAVYLIILQVVLFLIAMNGLHNAL